MEVGTRGGLVDVDVGYRFRPQVLCELLSPFGGAGKAHLFAVQLQITRVRRGRISTCFFSSPGSA